MRIFHSCWWKVSIDLIFSFFMAKVGLMINRVLEAVGLVKKSHLRKASTPSIFSDAYSSGLLPALGSNQSSKNVIGKKYIIHPYDRRYRYECRSS